ncbi:glycosyltransferase family 4 protein [Iningainema tapete]|uniref:Glycosyltransferase family 4 protein n=1 Tax=Iningainema tapete BLCC-T55 TaxID=2748662 RepID=A0A8J7CCN4_9CYAN|nr:glycosyltransferase family 4 protein [Iningainema tapete]MBD2772380.1 glycosyltransferase family 4 protein [Iningainema tapete BLCC-T55]
MTMHLAIIFINIGSYHAARLKAAYQACQKLGWQFTAIQVTDDTLEHSWGDFTSTLEMPTITLLPIASTHNPRNDTFSSVASKVLIKHLTQLKPDAVLIPGWSFPVARAALKWCSQNQVIPILMSETNEHDSPRIWWREIYKSLLVRRYKAALSGGQKHKQYLIKLGMPNDAIFLGYDVVDNDLFSPNKIKTLPNPCTKPYFLAINRFLPKKNLFTLLSSYGEYRQKVGARSWNLVLCGNGELQEKIEQYITELDLKDSVYLPGFLKPDELLPYFAHASCFVHASTQEQWGLVVNEAMAAGLPVIVSNRCGCFEDLIIEGVNGFGFNPENSQQLTDLMLRISLKEENLHLMGQAAWEHIQKFSPNYFAQNLIQAVEYALAHR